MSAAIDELVNDSLAYARKMYPLGSEHCKKAEDAAAELDQLRTDLRVKQALLDEAIRKGLQLCEQNGTLLMEAHKAHEELIKAEQMVLLALGDNEHGWKKEHVKLLQEYAEAHLDVLTGDGV